MRNLVAFFFVLFCILTSAVTLAADDILVADFEADNYGDWKVEGAALGNSPAKGTLNRQMHVSGYIGKQLVNTFLGGDKPIGTLTSPEFTIERDYIRFLIGGGGYKDSTCMNLLIDGKVVQTATGRNTKPGGSEVLSWQSWDVKQYRGQRAVLQIIDQATGCWGHINVDHIVQSDTEIPKLSSFERTREIDIEGKYLLLPIKNGGSPPFKGLEQSTMQILDVFIGGTLVHSPNIYLAHQKDEIDWWANLDVSEYIGKKARLRIRLLGPAAMEHMPADSKALDLIETSNAMRNLLPLYDEPLRPQFHHSQKRGWNNDPNGMVYYDGEYHLFWQSNPVGKCWANMYWGHSVSKEMIHWTELRPALRPNGQDEDGRPIEDRYQAMAVGHCHSGGATVDQNNTGGFQTGENKVMIITFTDTGPGRVRVLSNFSESLAYSNDRGRTWTLYKGNPIISHLGRDPKPFWYEAGGHWNIGVYDELDRERGIAFYKSDDLKYWERTGKLDNFFECPEVFQLPVDGDDDKQRWVMFAGDGQYVVGDFDGKQFKPEHPEKRRFIFGPVYAGQCFSNSPDGRVVYMGWVRRLKTGDAPFQEGFTIPLNLSLHETSDGIRMHGYPVKELDILHDGELFSVVDKTLTNEEDDISFETEEKIADIHLTIKPAKGAKTILLSFSDGNVKYDIAKGLVRADGIRASAESHPVQDSENITLRVLIDRPMYETFLNRGETYTLQRRDAMPLGRITLKTEGIVEEFKIYRMKSIWDKK